MATKLIELEDGILIEVDAREGEARQIAGGVAERISASLQNVQPLLTAVSKTIADAWQTVSQNVEIEKATVELGLSFEGEGNVFITKATAGANLIVTLELKPKARKKEHEA